LEPSKSNPNAAVVLALLLITFQFEPLIPNPLN